LDPSVDDALTSKIQVQHKMTLDEDSLVRPDWEQSRDDDDESDYDDEEEDEGSSSIWQELRESWRQHLVAVLIALVAALVAHSYLPKDAGLAASTGGVAAPHATPHQSPAAAPTIRPTNNKHPHLIDYRRTAHLSFCARLPDREGLQIMDFNVPKRLLPAVGAHLAADLLADDDYATVLQADFDLEGVLAEDLFYQCLQTQASLAPQQSYIKGLAYYSPTPAFESLYPDHGAQVSVKKTPAKISPTHLTFTGFAVKIVNLSPEPVLLHWDGPGDRRLIGEIGPYQALGTAATKAGQSFSVTPLHDAGDALARWTVTADEPVLYYQPDGVFHDHAQLAVQLLDKAFGRHYLMETGRHWLAHFPRPLPVHDQWPAAYFGQTHSLLASSEDDEPKKYHLKVVSVTPRVFEIADFLSSDECDTLVALALEAGLQASTLQAGGGASHQTTDRSTRSSSNTWLPRRVANVTDAIYRRAAQLLQMDESLLQKDSVGDGYHAHEHSLAESLQVVRYQTGEEYTAHHDFVYPPTFSRYQPTRFATLLLYLNDDFEGGQTVFPRAVNAQYHEGITVEPQKGKAILFYNMLADGNMDDLSQHSGQPVESGEKFLANLWVWDPHIY
jgi:prolyl 4-hydroxylase